jgi:hypothetical protein
LKYGLKFVTLRWALLPVSIVYFSISSWQISQVVVALLAGRVMSWFYLAIDLN